VDITVDIHLGYTKYSGVDITKVSTLILYYQCDPSYSIFILMTDRVNPNACDL